MKKVCNLLKLKSGKTVDLFQAYSIDDGSCKGDHQLFFRSFWQNQLTSHFELVIISPYA